MSAEPDGLRLRLERDLPAPRSVVFSAISEADELAKWWGPAGFTSPSVDFDPHVGGGYRIAMQPPDGDLFHLRGEFRQVDPPARLAYTFIWEEPDPDDRETIATLTLEDLGESTRLMLDQGPFLTEARLALHHDGWTDGFNRLEELMSAGAQEAG